MAPPSSLSSRIGQGRNEHLVENVTQRQTSRAGASSTRRCPRDRKNSDESRTRQKSPADGSFDEAIRLLLPRRCRCSRDLRDGPKVSPCLTMKATAWRSSTTSTTPGPLSWVRAFSSSSLLVLLPLKSLLLSVVHKSAWTVSEGVKAPLSDEDSSRRRKERWSFVEKNECLRVHHARYHAGALR
jgi:hypothetical protein